MVIDIHTHTFPDKLAAPTIRKLQGACHTRAFTDATNAGLAASMARAGIDSSVVLPVATNPHQVAHVNESAAQINARGRGTGIYSFGCIHPDCPDPRGELARIAALGLKGIKLHPAYQATRFDDIRYLRILDRAGELGLVVLTHAGIDIGIPAPTYCDPEMVLRALEQVGPVTLILAHMGGWRQWDQVEALLPQSSVLLDTAFSYGDLTPLEGHPFSEDQLHMMEQEQFVRFVRKFGAQRLLFGTDSPWGTNPPMWPLSAPCPSPQKSGTPFWAATPSACWGCSHSGPFSPIFRRDPGRQYIKQRARKPAGRSS